jgi:hypothetical protein
MENGFNRKLLTAARAILFAIGAAAGVLGIRQTFEAYPSLVSNPALRMVFYCVGAIVPALVLTLSAAPVLYAARALGAKLRGRFGGLRAYDAAGVMIGVVTGAMFGYICDAVTGLFLHVAALRILIDAAVAFVAAYVGAAASLHWLKSGDPVETFRGDGGYIFTASALAQAKTAALCERWLTGKKFVSDKTVAALAENPADERFVTALGNFRALSEAKAVSVAVFPCGEDEAEAFSAECARRGLKIVAATRAEAERFGGGTGVLSIDELQG